MSEGQLALLIPIMALSIPIIAILITAFTKHQQRMAEIIHASHAAQQNPAIDQLRMEVRELKEIVASQAIALDNLADVQRKMLGVGSATLPSEQQIAERLRNG